MGVIQWRLNKQWIGIKRFQQFEGLSKNLYREIPIERVCYATHRQENIGSWSRFQLKTIATAMQGESMIIQTIAISAMPLKISDS